MAVFEGGVLSGSWRTSASDLVNILVLLFFFILWKQRSLITQYSTEIASPRVTWESSKIQKDLSSIHVTLFFQLLECVCF